MVLNEPSLGGMYNFSTRGYTLLTFQALIRIRKPVQFYLYTPSLLSVQFNKKLATPH